MPKPLVDRDFIKGSNNGNCKVDMTLYSYGGMSDLDINMFIANEYSRVVTENPEYDFSIISDAETRFATIWWTKRLL